MNYSNPRDTEDPTFRKEKPVPPEPEILRMFQRVITAGIRTISPQLKSDREKTILRIALKRLGRAEVGQ